MAESNAVTSAKQATDGSHLLAIADGRFVYIQDTEQDIVRRKHTLSAASGHIQYLGFAPGTQELYFTTNLQNSVRRYGVRSNKLEQPLCELPSPPSVLAVNRHHLVAACEAPPSVILRALSSKGKTVALSLSAPVTLAAFHPSQADLFLLAYAQGIISVHNTAHAMRRSSSNGQIGFIEDLNSSGTSNCTIIAAQFLPGPAVRTVILDDNMTCRVVGFYKGLPTVANVFVIDEVVSSLVVGPGTASRDECVVIGTAGGKFKEPES